MNELEKTTAVPDASARGSEVRSRRTMIAAAVIAAVVLAGGGTAWALSSSSSASSQTEPSMATATIERGTLRGELTVRGSLAYSPLRSVEAGRDGIVTGLPPVGTVVERGGALVTVNNLASRLLYGSIPAWRSFEMDMPDGPDVLQLEENLVALGYLDAADTRFTWATRQAIMRWQKDRGVEQTGTLALGDVIFRPSAVRVSKQAVTVGDSVTTTTAALEITSLTREVTLSLSAQESTMAKVGDLVTVILPDGSEAEATVAAVGAPKKADDGSTTHPVTLAPSDQSLVAEVTDPSVSVILYGETREDVLFVPVGALTAIDGTTFAVQVVRDDGTVTSVPVTVGLFSAGSVEISGDGISEGLTVLVPGS